MIGCGGDAAKVESLQAEVGLAACALSVVDVAKEAQVAAWAMAAGTLYILSYNLSYTPLIHSQVSEHGVPHLLINNAGVITEKRQLWLVDGADFAKLLDTNVGG